MRKQISLWTPHIFVWSVIYLMIPDILSLVQKNKIKIAPNLTFLSAKTITPSHAHGIPSFPTRLVLSLPSLAPVLIWKIWNKIIRTTISDFNEFIMTWIIFEIFNSILKFSKTAFASSVPLKRFGNVCAEADDHLNFMPCHAARLTQCLQRKISMSMLGRKLDCLRVKS